MSTSTLTASLALLLVAGAAAAAAEPNLKNCVQLSENTDLRLYWTLDAQHGVLHAAVQQTHLGWVGIGLQPKALPSMGPGDFWTMWLEQDGNVVLQDRYLNASTPFGLPDMDEQQNLRLTNASLSDEGTFSVSFDRLLETGDADDLNLTKSVLENGLSVLFAWGPLPAGQTPAYHGPNRGRAEVDLLKPSQCRPSPCPAACSTHGRCNVTTKRCLCDAGWLGDDCARRNLTEAVTLPEGFKLEYHATGVTNARSMALSGADPSLLYVGTRSEGNVYAVVDADLDGTADRVVTIASGLLMPNGVAWHNGSLYVAQPSRLIRFDRIDETYASKPQFTVLDIGFTIPTANGNWHAWHSLHLGPSLSDDAAAPPRLYFTIGSPCNYCLNGTNSPGNPPTKLHLPWGTLSSVRLDGSDYRMHARGIRNSVGFDFTEDGNVFFTDNGRDQWGSDRPDDELNFVDMSQPPRHYGFPFCYGGENGTDALADPLFNHAGTCDDKTYAAAQAGLGPHVAALGVRFYRGQAFPPSYRGAALIAMHGSWNRPPGELDGYKVVVARFAADGRSVTSVDDLVTGFLDADKATKWARPVDVLPLADGSVLISDSFGGAIFRLSYTG